MTGGATTNNQAADVPSVLLTPVAGDQATNIEDTVVTDGFWTADQICTAPYVAACQQAGIS